MGVAFESLEVTSARDTLQWEGLLSGRFHSRGLGINWGDAVEILLGVGQGQGVGQGVGRELPFLHQSLRSAAALG